MTFRSKRLVAALTLCALVFTAIPLAAAPTASDIEGHWAKTAIEQLVNMGAVSGLPDGTFRPDLTVTRAEFVTMVNKSLGITPITGSTRFQDVKPDDWFAGQVEAAAANGYVTGNPDGTFSSYRPITREQAAAMLVRAFGFDQLATEAEQDAVLASFVDADQVSAWAKADVATAVSLELMSGYTATTLAPQPADLSAAEWKQWEAARTTEQREAVLKQLGSNGLITRAQTAAILVRALALKPAVEVTVFDEAGIYGPEDGTETISGDVIIRAEDVTLQNLIITGDLIIDERVGDGTVILENVTVKGDTEVKGGGTDSVIFRDCTLYGTVTVEKEDGQIRIVAEGSTSVPKVVLQSGAILISRDDGSFEQVELPKYLAKNTEVVLTGSFTEVEIAAEKANVKVGEGSKVDNLVLTKNATGTQVDLDKKANVKTVTANAEIEITGKGSIARAEINTDGVTIEQKPDKTVLEPGVKANVGGKDVSEPKKSSGGGGGGGGSKRDRVSIDHIADISLEKGKTRTVTVTTSPTSATITATASLSGIVTLDVKDKNITITGKKEGTTIITVTASRSGYNDGTKTFKVHVTADGEPEVPVSAISVTPTELTLTVGETEKITATVKPSNATNKKVNWTTSDADVATVDENGEVKAVAVGTATVTATSAADSTKKASCEVTVEAAAPITVESVSVVDGADGYTPVTIPKVEQVIRANITLSDGTVIGTYPVNENAKYKWYYQESADTVLGAEGSYTVTSDNFGKTICVKVSVDGYEGTATWEAKGPVALVANFESTGNVGIAPDSAGEAAGKIYAEYKLVANEEDISLAEGNVEYIKVKVDDEEWQDLTANTDATLWFNVEKATGTYEYEVKTTDGNVYTATLDWKEEIKTATWKATDREGDHEEVTYVEYKLMYGENQVSLKIGEVKLIASEDDGKWVKLDPNTDSTLWFNKAKATGNYDFFVVTSEGVMYKATLDWIKPGEEPVEPQPIAANFVSTGNVGIAPDAVGEAAGKIYAEYKLVANEEDISLASDNVEYIKVKVDEGEWQTLTANTDATLWFNVEAVTGLRTFEVKTKDGKVYTATLDWKEEINDVSFTTTGREGTRPGTEDTYVEYEIKVGEGERLSLAEGAVKLIAQQVGEKWVELEPNTDETLWFKKDKATGNYDFFVVTSAGVMYKATLEWTEAIAADVDYNAVWNETRGTWYIKVSVPEESLDVDSVTSINAIKEAGIELTEPRTLTPDTDKVLWFGVAKGDGDTSLKTAGEYAYEVIRKDGTKYIFNFTYAPGSVTGATNLVQAALEVVNVATTKQEMIGAIEENAGVLGLDIGVDSDYAKLVNYPSEANSRHWSVGVDLIHKGNKPDSGYDIDSLKSTFDAIVSTRLATQASMDHVNNATSVETLGMTWVTDLLAQFKAADAVYDYHSGILLTDKIATLESFVNRYNALPTANQEAALKAVLEGAPYARSQATTEALDAALTEQEGIIGEAALQAVNTAADADAMKAAIEENADILGLDLTNYSTLIDDRKPSVSSDLLSNKPDVGGYDLATLQEYFDAIVATRLVTQQSMDKANNATTVAELEGYVTMLLDRFEAASGIYTIHSGIALTEKVELLSGLMERYNKLDETEKTAVLEKVLELRTDVYGGKFGRSQYTTDAFKTALEAVEAELGAIAKALAEVNAYLTPESYDYSGAPEALEEHLAVLGLDVGAESDYAALDKTADGGKNRKTAVFYDLNSNKPDGGYDLATLTTYFNEMVDTRLVTEASMDIVNDAKTIENLEGISFVTMLLDRFKAVSYETHSDIPIADKVSTLQNLVTRYGALDADGQAAVLQKLLDKRPTDGYARSQATTDALAVALTEAETEINARLTITSVSIVDNKAYASTAANGGTVRVLGYGVGINLDAKGENKKVSDTESIVIELYNGNTLLGQQTFSQAGYTNHGDKSAISGTIDAGGEYIATSWDNSWSAGIADIPTKAVATVKYSDGTATAEKALSFTDADTKIFFAAEAVHALFEDVFVEPLVLADGVTQDDINTAQTLVNKVTIKTDQNKVVLGELITQAQGLYDAENPVAPTATFEFVSGFDSFKAGTENSFSIKVTATNIDNTTRMKYKATFKKGDTAVAGQEISYEEGKGTNNWQTFSTGADGVAYFGPASGFTMTELDLSQGVTTDFKATIAEAGSYTLTVELINAKDSLTIGEAGTKTFTVAEQTETP